MNCFLLCRARLPVGTPSKPGTPAAMRGHAGSVSWHLYLPAYFPVTLDKPPCLSVPLLPPVYNGDNSGSPLIELF